MEQNDAQLIRRILQGDQDAFSALVKKYQKGAHALAWRKIGDFHIAQEITQDAFLTVYKKLGTLRNPNAFAGWLYVIVARLSSDWLRRNRLTMESLDADTANAVDKVSYSQYVAEEQATEADETRREVVKELLKKLPESERTVITLHYLGEMTIKAVSEFLGVSPNTVKSRLRRARNRLKKEEGIIRENLGSFQLTNQLTENIMREVSRLTPAAPATSKPMVPWAALGAAAVLVVLMLGVSNQYLARFQQPYSFEAESEPTIEIVDTPIILDIATKPAVRNQFGRTNSLGESSSAGTKIADTTSASVTLEDSDKFATAQWTRGNTPPGGYVHNVFTTSKGTVYAVSSTGLYRLAADTATWTHINVSVRINNDSPVPMTEHGGNLYIVSEDGILTSGDKGETWHTLGPRPKGRAVGLTITDAPDKRNTPADITLYLALGDEGIFRSTDGGTRWQSLNDGLTGEQISTVVAVEKTVFAGTNRGLYRLDSGIWNKLPIDTLTAVYSLAVSENNLYVGSGSDMSGLPPIEIGQPLPRSESHTIRIFHSADLGTSWTEITPKYKNLLPGPPSGLTVLAAGETLLALGVYPTYSIDGGQTWTELGFDPYLTLVSSLAAASGDERTFYKTGVFGIHRTTDGGKSWHLFMNGMMGTRLNDLVVFNNRLYAHTSHEVYQSTNEGMSWKKVRIDGEDNSGTSFSNDSNLVISDNSLYFLSHINDGVRIRRLSTDGNMLIPIQGVPTFDDKALSTESRTDSEEATRVDLSEITSDHFDEYAKTKSFAISHNVFYIEYRRRLFKYRLGDSEWTNTGFVDTSEQNDEDYAKGFSIAVLGDTVYVGKRDGRLFQSLDEGSNWRDVTPNLPLRFTRFKEIVFSGSTVYVATDEGVLVSETGEHWRVIRDRTDTRVVITQFAVDGTEVYGIGDTGTYRLDTRGRWEQISSEVVDEIVALAVTNGQLYSAVWERGVFHISLEEAADNGLTHE